MERLIVTKMMILWKRKSTFMKKRLQTPQTCSCQLENLQSMGLPSMVCWIVDEDDGKGSEIFSQFAMDTLTNHLLSKLVTCPYTSIVNTRSVSQRSNVTMYAKYSHLKIDILVK